MSEQVRKLLRRIEVDPKNEVAMVQVLIDSGEGFSAFSKTGYVISGKQCEALNKENIPYTKL